MKDINIGKYKLTDAYIELEEELNIQIFKDKLTKEQADKFVLFVASEYFRYVDNDKNAWNIIKECLQQISVVLPVIDMVNFKRSMQKHFYVVFEKNREEIIEIFQKLKVALILL